MTTLGVSGVPTTGTRAEEAVAETAAGNDERRRARIAGLALIASPILWFVGALVSQVWVPQLGGFYGQTNRGDPVARVNALAGQQGAWTVQSVLFVAGTVAAVVGLALLASLLWRTRAATLARAGVVGLVAVMGISAFGFVMRVTAPTQGIRDLAEVPALLIAMHSPAWLGTVFTVVTMVTVAIYAAALFWSGRAKVMGALVVALCGLLLVAIFTAGPPPPVMVYPIAALLGVRLLFWGAPDATHSVR